MERNNNYQTRINDLGLEIVIFLGVWILCMILGGVLAQGILAVSGVENIQTLFEIGDKKQIGLIRIIQAVSSSCSYILPGIILSFFLFRKKWKKQLFLDRAPKFKNIGLSLAIIAASSGFISFVYYYNTALIPEAYISKTTLAMEQQLLQMNNFSELLANVLIFGFIAGIGEELIFRGFLQRFLTQWTKNIHVGAFLTAIAFTLMHFQLEGFFPRLILSLFFSYLLIGSGNLWITILIHIVFNSYQVILYYFAPELIGSVDKVSVVPWSYALFSLLCTFLLWITFAKVNRTLKYNYLLNNNNKDEFKS